MIPVGLCYLAATAAITAGILQYYRRAERLQNALTAIALAAVALDVVVMFTYSF